MLKLRTEIHNMKEKLHSTSWDAGCDSLTTRNFIQKINDKRAELVKLMESK